MRKKAYKEAMLEQKAKEEALKNEALDFYRQLRESAISNRLTAHRSTFIEREIQ
jgi:hypothetical protein